MAGNHGNHYDGAQGVITGKVIIKELLQACPQAADVIRKHLGPMALSIPGSETEAIEFLAAMHDYHEDKLLQEINQVCKQPPVKVGHF